jgi:hypothetical protein
VSDTDPARGSFGDEENEHFLRYTDQELMQLAIQEFGDPTGWEQVNPRDTGAEELGLGTIDACYTSDCLPLLRKKVTICYKSGNPVTISFGPC